MSKQTIDLNRLKETLPYHWVFSHFANPRQSVAFFAPYVPKEVGANHLDEVVGPENWKTEHFTDGKYLFCRLSIRINGEWISRTNNGTSQEKGDSDTEKSAVTSSTKRAMQEWGIGRELKRWGTIRVPVKEINGKHRVYDIYKNKVLYSKDEINNYVMDIFENRRPIYNDWENRTNHRKGITPTPQENPPVTSNKNVTASDEQIELIKGLFAKYTHKDAFQLHRFYNSFESIEGQLASKFIDHLNGKSPIKIPEQFLKEDAPDNIVNAVIVKMKKGYKYKYDQLIEGYNLSNKQHLLLESAIEEIELNEQKKAS